MNMPIEKLIADNTAAIAANTEVLLRILERSEGTTEAPAAATPKADKPKDKAPAKPKLTVVTPKAEEPEEDADEDSEELTHEILVARVQAKFDSTEGAELNAAKRGFKELREKFDVKTIKDLTEEQFADFAAGIAAL